MTRPSTTARVAAFHTGAFDTIGFLTAWSSCLRQSLLAPRFVASGRSPLVDGAQRIPQGRFRLVRRRQCRRDRPRLSRKPLKSWTETVTGKPRPLPVGGG